MRILLDQCTPRKIRRWLPGHDIQPAAKLGWEDFKNGKLLNAAEESGFDLLITVDQNIAYQQNLTKRQIAILAIGTGNWPAMHSIRNKIVNAVNSAVPGSYTLIEIVR